MSRQIRDVLDAIDERAPFSSAAHWDAVGLQLGDPGREAAAVAVAHELTPEVTRRVIEHQVDLVVTYHPLVFQPLRSVTARPGPEGRSLVLVEAGVGVIAVHTNWDVAEGGTSDSLATALELSSVEPFAEPDDSATPRGGSEAIGRVGDFAGTGTRLRDLIATSLGGVIRTAGLSASDPRRVAVLPGSGGSHVGVARDAGADVFVTGDVSHHEARLALDHGMAIIDPGHGPTERPGVRALYAAVVEIVGEAFDLTRIDDSPWEGG